MLQLTPVSLTLVLIAVKHLCLADYNCNSAYWCSARTSVSSTESVNCRGYFSCYDCTTISAPNEDVYCDGAYSCYQSYSLQSNGIYCRGLYSCAQIDIISGIQSIYCGGERSCSNSFILRPTNAWGTDGVSSNTIWLTGFESGAYADISLQQTSQVKVTGSFGFYHGNIDIYSSSTLRAWAAFSITESSINCHSDATCTIMCYGLGCYNVESVIENGTGSFNIDCSYNLIANKFCSNELDFINNAIDEIPLLTSENILATSENGENGADLCDSVTYGCNNYQGCATDYTSIFPTQAICCTAGESCEYTNLESREVINNLNSTDAVAIGVRCDGFESCQGSQFLTYTIDVNDHGDVFCSGLYSCQYLDIDNTRGIRSTFADVYCVGEYSCRSSTMERWHNIYCIASYSCHSSTTRKITGDIYGYGIFSLYESYIYNVTGNVYCVSYYSCYGANIREVKGNAYIIGYQSLYGGILSNSIHIAMDKVFIIGEEAARGGATISNVNRLYASGLRVLWYASISGIRKLYINGTDGLSYSTIVTEINDDNVSRDDVFMYIAGNNYYGYNVHCSVNDTCYIICQTIDACSQMTLYCQGLCYVSCDNNNTGCPNTGSGNWYFIGNVSEPTASPTPLPTSLNYTTRYPETTQQLQPETTDVGIKFTTSTSANAQTNTVDEQTSMTASTLFDSTCVYLIQYNFYHCACGLLL